MKQTLHALKNVLLAVGLTSVFTTAVAQEEKHCGTDEALQKIFAKYPELKAQHEQYYAQQLQQMYSGTSPVAKTAIVEDTLYIPIVFHIIHQYGTEDITDAQVYDQVNILNRDYMKRNADTSSIIPPYKPVAAKTYIQFRLATLDPQGNCTNGIEHIYSHMTNSGDDFSKLSGWPQNKYLNVWVVKTIGSQGVAGYAFYPSAIGSPYMIMVDGVLILNDYIGSIGTSSAFSSRALTHEIGHYLGLPHTWGDTNSPGVACGDEGIYDTPMTKGHSTCSPLYDAGCDITDIAKKFLFTGITTTSGATDPTNIIKDSVVSYTHPAAIGISSNSSANGQLAFTNWDTGGADHDTVYANQTGTINTNKYYEITVTPRLGVYLTLSNIKFHFQRNATGVRTFAVRSSADGYASNLTTTTTNTALVKTYSNVFYSLYDTAKYINNLNVTLSAPTFSAMTSPVTFRFYGWNAEDAAGSFRIDSLQFIGNGARIENIQNYMEYSYCSNMFTRDQKTVMRFSLSSNTGNRANLVTQTNHVATGTTGAPAAVCSPLADFKATYRSVCQGVSIPFTALPRRAAATSYSWTFTNGTPATSTASAPSVSFSTPGWQQVSLTVANSVGSDTKTETQYIYVSPNWADITGPYNEDVETSSAGRWVIDNPENNNGFDITGNAGVSGSHSFFYNALQHGSSNPYYDEQLGENKDAIISPKYNLNYVSGVTLSFKYSCVTRGGSSTQITEKLTVYKSIDCGKTWSIAGNASNSVIKGGALANAGYAAGSFVPSSPSQWKTVNIPLSLTTGQYGNVRIKIEYQSSDVSNCIYIDDININGTVGIDENASDYFNLNVYPNPSQSGGDITVDYFSHGKKVNITITDMLGRQVYNVTDENQTGTYQKNISGSESKLKSGMYFVSVSDGVSRQIKKIIIN